MAINTRTLLEGYMAGNIITEVDIENLLSSGTQEDLYLEYKNGKELLKPNPGNTIRQYLTGFANSEGGLLIIGVSDDLRVESRSVPGGRGFGNWAATSLSDIFSLFSPPPRFQEVNHRDGVIYIAGVSRSLNLIPCREGNGFAYYLRIHDQTRRAPDYLVSDLIVGRRQYPLLNISGVDVPSANITHHRDYSAAYAELQLTVTVENLNLNWAESLRLGIINYSCSDYGASISSQLLSYVDMRGWPTNVLPGDFTLYHSIQRINDIEPFTENHENLSRDMNLPLKSKLGEWVLYKWRAALYIIGRNMPPVWYQITLDVDQEFMDGLRTQKNIRNSVKISRITENRPIIAVDDLR